MSDVTVPHHPTAPAPVCAVQLTPRRAVPCNLRPHQHDAASHFSPRTLQVVRSSSPGSECGRLAAELEVLCRVRHPHVVQFLGACIRSEPVMIVSELMSGGSLANALEQRPLLPLRRALEIALDCARGLNCLHMMRPHPIIHRDLTPSNVLLSQPEVHTMKVRPSQSPL